MKAYEALIIEDTGCRPDDVALIDDIMRNEVFHSTLDWQTRARFRQGARKAAKILEGNRELFEEYRAQTLAVFNRMRQA
ncbi:MAG: hypothetical protein ABSH01_14685 [Terriglobia bacterium]|jgi:hypothetical protein